MLARFLRRSAQSSLGRLSQRNQFRLGESTMDLDSVQWVQEKDRLERR